MTRFGNVSKLELQASTKILNIWPDSRFDFPFKKEAKMKWYT